MFTRRVRHKAPKWCNTHNHSSRNSVANNWFCIALSKTWSLTKYCSLSRVISIAVHWSVWSNWCTRPQWRRADLRPLGEDHLPHNAGDRVGLRWTHSRELVSTHRGRGKLHLCSERCKVPLGGHHSKQRTGLFPNGNLAIAQDLVASKMASFALCWQCIMKSFLRIFRKKWVKVIHRWQHCSCFGAVPSDSIFTLRSGDTYSYKMSSKTVLTTE